MLLLFVVVVSVGIGLTVEAFNRTAQGTFSTIMASSSFLLTASTVVVACVALLGFSFTWYLKAEEEKNERILEQARTSPTQEVTRTPKKARRYAAQTKRTPCVNDKSGAVVPYLAVATVDAHSSGVSHCDSGGVDAGGDCGGSL